MQKSMEIMHGACMEHAWRCRRRMRRRIRRRRCWWW